MLHPPITEVRRVVTAALAEDLTPLGDLSAALVDPAVTATAAFVPRSDGVLAGTACATEAFAQLDPSVRVAWSATDGDRVTGGRAVGTVEGPLRSILTAERTALNFLNHLSGVATLTARFVAAAAPVKVWDTRKTTPGLRALEKAAVRAGGGWNHRGNLSDWVMLKDNHLARLGIAEAVGRARAAWPARTIHVEADSLEKVQEALDAGADAILLDNLGVDGVARAVALADAHAAAGGRRPLLEASGGVTLDTIGGYATTGVDVISTSQITISAPVLDIGLDIEP